MQIKTSSRHHSFMKNFKPLTTCSVMKVGEIGTLICCWKEFKIVQPLWRGIWQYLIKLHITLSFDLAISPQEFTLNLYFQQYMHKDILGRIICNCQVLKTIPTSKCKSLFVLCLNATSVSFLGHHMRGTHDVHLFLPSDVNFDHLVKLLFSTT